MFDKKTLLAGAAALLMTGAAQAQVPNVNTGGTSDSVAIPLSGTLEKQCLIGANLINGPFDDIDMTDTTKQSGESLSVLCNYGGSADIEFVSANNGNLVSGANSVEYSLEVSGGLLSPTVLSTPATGTFSGFSANNVASRTMSITLSSAATVAGTYTDTITATVTPN